MKSTLIVGGSQLLGVVVGIMRNKVVAYFLGPVGVGIIGLYQGIIDLIKSSTSLGIGFGAVRDIAAAENKKERKLVHRVISVMTKWAWITGLIGLLLMLVFSKIIGEFTFSDSTYNLGVAVLSITILLSALASAKLAILQGLRQLFYLALANISGIFIGFIISIPLYWFLGVRGIVPSLLINSISALVISHILVGKLSLTKERVTLKEAFSEGLGMIKLGSLTVVTGISSAFTLYAIRYILISKMDVAAVGYFQASWMISYVYLASILYAMSADYYPRLSAVKNSELHINKLANEQVEIGMLIASPLLIGILTFAHLVVPILYSNDFKVAIPILQWQLIGSYMKVLSFPITYILLVKDRGAFYILTEVLRDLLYLVLIEIGWNKYDFEILGIAYFTVYVSHFILTYYICKRLFKLRFSAFNVRLLIISTAIICFAYINVAIALTFNTYVIGGFLILIISLVSYNRLRKLFDLRSYIMKYLGKD